MELTPKEKAIQIFKRFATKTLIDFSDENFEMTRDCSLICISELLDSVPFINNTVDQCKKRIYYMDVRSELKKL